MCSRVRATIVVPSLKRLVKSHVRWPLVRFAPFLWTRPTPLHQSARFFTLLFALSVAIIIFAGA